MKMKSSGEAGLKICGVIVLICAVTAFCVYILPMLKTFHEWRQQMLAGQKYMDSLTEKDFQVWTARTQKYLSNFNPTNWALVEEAVPSGLKELKIVSVYCENSNSVDYVWMGGFDHTMLHVELLTNGQFEFNAIYNDQSNRVIWPK
jgi:hypothetical protein